MLINGVLRSVLGGRRRRSRRALRYLSRPLGRSIWSNPNLLLTAAGLAWGVFETLQQGQAPSPAAGADVSTPQAGVQALPPLPGAATSGTVSDESLRIVRLAISAAHADGTVSEKERQAIVEQARQAGVDAVVERELAEPRLLADIVTGVTDSAQRAALYVLAFGIVRGDEQPTGAERIYLAKLADLLGLDASRVQQLETQTAQGIDQSTE
jgi:uncharacterized membrane protein YebE (DUF533 family)